MRSAVVVAAALGLLSASAAGAEARTLGAIVPDLPNAHVAVHHPRAHAAADLPYGGGPVLHNNRTHLIFWQPAGSGLSFDPGYEALIEQFLRRVAADSHHPGNVYGLTGQYTDPQGAAAYASSYGSATVDTDALPRNGCLEPPVTGPGWTVCLTDKQLQAELDHVIRSRQLPVGPTDIYFLVTPRGLGSCTDASSTSCALGGDVGGYCGYHAQSTGTHALYAVIPYNAVPPHCQSNNPRPNRSTADPTMSVISHEHSEMVTDPFGDAWVDSSDQEDGDLCAASFGPTIGGSGAGAWNERVHGGHYYLQEEWSNADNGCRPRARPARVSFRARPLPAAPGSVAFSAHGTTSHGSIVSFKWFFGDGRSARGAGVSHHYRHAGRYRVVLRATDSWANWTYAAETLAVSGRRRRAADTKSG